MDQKFKGRDFGLFWAPSVSTLAFFIFFRQAETFDWYQFFFLVAVTFFLTAMLIAIFSATYKVSDKELEKNGILFKRYFPLSQLENLTVRYGLGSMNWLQLDEVTLEGHGAKLKVYLHKRKETEALLEKLKKVGERRVMFEDKTGFILLPRIRDFILTILLFVLAGLYLFWGMRFINSGLWPFK